MKYWYETHAVAQRILLELWRRKRSLVFWVVFPISILVINGLILAERGKFPIAQGIEQAAPPTLMGSALFFSCLGGAVATVVSEREQRTLKRLFLSPLSGISYFLGIFVAHGAIALGQVLLVFTIVVSQGAWIKGSILLAGSIILLGIFAYVGLGFLLGTQFARRTEDVNSLVAAFGVPLLILGGSFFPVSVFPDILLRIAEFNPIYHMNEALYGVVVNGDGLEAIANHYAFLSVFAVAMVVLGWLSYQRMLMGERRL
ncbi:ABC transporter permease [Tumidithrix elongata RA019]|uniref:ABC transporter permease n=1 Tax=Tumidithrix elongata BACA0141 TaxID=2716417 RepID=A0AAW9PUH9_9CYAN|nr:ABC transporter permease [Tumidithrix elongata RA019]